MKTIAITELTEIEAIIRKCPYCTVGITDLEGNPYVVPMNFAYRDGIIYLHSGPEGSKVTMAEKHPHVCITFCEGHELVYMHRQVACSYSMKSRSVICHGNVRFIEDMDEKRETLDIIMQQYTSDEFKYSEPAVRNVKVWEVKIDKMTWQILRTATQRGHLRVVTNPFQDGPTPFPPDSYTLYCK